MPVDLAGIGLTGGAGRQFGTAYCPGVSRQHNLSTKIGEVPNSFISSVAENDGVYPHAGTKRLAKSLYGRSRPQQMASSWRVVRIKDVSKRLGIVTRRT
jgi:hypothetical protein